MTRDDIVQSIIELQTAQIEGSIIALMQVSGNLRKIAAASLEEIDEILARVSVIEDLGVKIHTTADLSKLRDTLKIILNNVPEPVGPAYTEVTTDLGNLTIDVLWDTE